MIVNETKHRIIFRLKDCKLDFAVIISKTLFLFFSNYAKSFFFKSGITALKQADREGKKIFTELL